VAKAKKSVSKAGNGTGANLGFEQKLWQAADKMRGHMDAAEYKHVALGLIFLKYISDAFAERHQALLNEIGADPEDRDEYTAENVFWVPKRARWEFLQANAKKAEIGKLIDDAMVAIEKENQQLKGVLPKDYARPALDKQRLGELIDLIGTIGLGDAENRSKDILGRVYEYFLSQFASAEGKKGGEFYTPRCVVCLLVEMIEPYKGRVYDLVRTERGIHRAARRARGRHLDLRPGVEPDHVAAGEDEPGAARHRGEPRAAPRRHLPQRSAQGPQGRLHPRQSALQHERLGRREPEGRRALEIRRAAGGQRQLRLGRAHDPPPCAERNRRLRPGEWFDVVAAFRRRRHPQKHCRG
jgi:hypothetical protein